MSVYVESGFVITLALQQDDYQSAERVIQLAQQRRMTLKIPSFSLSEPLATVQYRANSRNRLIADLRGELRELGRTAPYESMSRELAPYLVRLSDVRQAQLDALETVLLTVGGVCELLQMDTTVLKRAASYKMVFDLRLPDAIVLASVMLDLEQLSPNDRSLFISQNADDFANPAIKAELQRLQCRYISNFADALRYIERPGGTV